MDNAQEARRMLRAHRYGALSTQSQKFAGYPFGSITPYLVDRDGSLLILISALAEHTKNINQNACVSLITHDQRDAHIQTQGRVTVLGEAKLQADKVRCGERYLRYFPEAQTYFEMGDFQFYRIQPKAVRYIAGFGRIHWINMENYAVEASQISIELERDLIATLNQHPAILLAALQRHCQLEATQAEVIGIDADGIDARAAEGVWRLSFPENFYAVTVADDLLAWLRA